MSSTDASDPPSAIAFWIANREAFDAYAAKKQTTASSETATRLNRVRAAFDYACLILEQKTAYSLSPEALSITQVAERDFDDIRKTHTETHDYLDHLTSALDAVLGKFLAAPMHLPPASNRRKRLDSDEEPFQAVKTKRPAKRSAVSQAPPVSTSNSFQALETDPATEQATPMEAATQPQSASQPPKPPPVTVPSLPRPLHFNKDLRSRLQADFKTVSTRDGIKIYTTTVDDFRTLKAILTEEKVEYFTYQLRQERPLRVMIRRLPNNVDVDDIKAALTDLQYKVIAVRQLQKSENGVTTLFPLYAVSLERDAHASTIYSLTSLMHSIVRVESYKTTPGIKQCFRCQRFHHTFRECQLPTRCVICAGSHNHKECPVRDEARTDSQKLRCANCDTAGHTASSKTCPHYLAELARTTTEHAQRQPAQQRLFTTRPVLPGRSYSAAVSPSPVSAPTLSYPPNCSPSAPEPSDSATPGPSRPPETPPPTQLIDMIMTALKPLIESLIAQFFLQLPRNASS